MNIIVPCSLRLFTLAAVMASLPLTAQARIDRVVEKEFAVSTPGSLHVETSAGSIKVTPSEDSMVRIKVKQRIRATTEAEADLILKKLNLELEQTGNDIRAIARYEKLGAGFSFGFWPPVQVDFEVTAPMGFANNLVTSGGSISVGNFSGQAKLRTSGGSITLGRMGGAVDAKTSGGNITLAEAAGGVSLKTSGGSISVGRVFGPAELATSGGSIKIESAEGQLRAHTSGGSIRAGITGRLTDESHLITSGGGVSVSIGKAAAFRLDAAATGGRVDAEGLTLTLEKSGRSQLVGSVNGGEPLLKLRTSGGSISVRAM